MSWFSNAIRGKHPMTPGRTPVIARPPAGGPGTTPGAPQYPFGYHESGGNIPQTPVPPVGSRVTQTGGSMAEPDMTGYDTSGLSDAAKDFLKEHWDELLKAGIIIAGGREAIQNSQKANELMEQGLGMAKEDYASRAPFREAGRQNMLDPRTPDLSSIFADPGNPYARGRTVPVVGSRVPKMESDVFKLGDPNTPLPPPGGRTGVGPEAPVPERKVFALGGDAPLPPPGTSTGTPITQPPHMRRDTRVRSVGRYA